MANVVEKKSVLCLTLIRQRESTASMMSNLQHMLYKPQPLSPAEASPPDPQRKADESRCNGSRLRRRAQASNLWTSKPTGVLSMRRSIMPFAFALLAASCARNPGTIAPAGGERRIVGDDTRHRIDSTLRAFVESGKVAGISALVWEKGSESYFGAFGFADREARRPMTRDAIVQIYSMTKPTAGVAVMQLYEA